jgi:hypothetical protein
MRESPPDEKLREAARLLREAGTAIGNLFDPSVEAVDGAERTYQRLTAQGAGGDLLLRFSIPWSEIWKEIDYVPDEVDYVAEMLAGDAEAYQEQYDD